MTHRPTRITTRSLPALVAALLAVACAPKPIPPAAAAPGAGDLATGVDAWGSAGESAPASSDAPWGAQPTSAPASTAGPTTSATAAPSAMWTKGFSEGEIRQLDDAVSMLYTHDEGKAQAALERLQALAKEHPDAAVVWYNMGVAAQVSGNLEEARKDWSRAAEVDPTFARACAETLLAHLSAPRPL